jgi:hypothetical protein
MKLFSWNLNYINILQTIQRHGAEGVLGILIIFLVVPF